MSKVSKYTNHTLILAFINEFLNMNKRRYWVIGLLLFMPFTFANTADQTPIAKASLSVSVTTPESVHWDQQVLANGAISAWQEAIIASEIAGQRIETLLVDVGDQVTKGQLLVQLSQSVALADLAQAKAQVALAKANLGEAHANAQRASALKVKQALSSQQVDQYLTSEAAAAASLAVQKAGLLAQQIKLKKTRVLAVDDGLIVQRNAALGEVVQVGTELFRLIRQNKLEWQAEVSGRDSALIEEGQIAHLQLPSNQTVSGVVRRIAPTLDPNTRNSKVYISLPIGGPAKVGMFAQGAIVIGSSNGIAVPQSAVIPRDGKYYVFEVSQNNEIVQRTVEIGRTQNALVEIVAGLKSQTRVVASGGAFLNDGDVVSVVDKWVPEQPVSQGNSAL